MARINNLTNFLTDVATAIRSKKGSEATIAAEDFDTEILSIETGGNYQSKTLNVTQNGNYNLLPDQEFDALSNVNISVSVSPVLQNKTVTENGSYSADSGYDGLGTVIVNVPQEGGSGDVKLFETEEEMQADPNPQEGDLAIVYNTSIPDETGTITNYVRIGCPSVIVLSTAITSTSITRRLVARLLGTNNALYVRYNNTSITFAGSYSGTDIFYSYTSSDGLTYTRTSGTNEIEWLNGLYTSLTTYTVVLEMFKIKFGMFGGFYEYRTDIEDTSTGYVTKYWPALTQLSKITNDKLVGTITAYAYNGTITGNNTDWLDNVTNSDAFEKVLGSNVVSDTRYDTCFIDTGAYCIGTEPDNSIARNISIRDTYTLNETNTVGFSANSFDFKGVPVPNTNYSYMSNSGGGTFNFMIYNNGEKVDTYTFTTITSEGYRIIIYSYYIILCVVTDSTATITKFNMMENTQQSITVSLPHKYAWKPNLMVYDGKLYFAVYTSSSASGNVTAYRSLYRIDFDTMDNLTRLIYTSKVIYASASYIYVGMGLSDNNDYLILETSSYYSSEPHHRITIDKIKLSDGTITSYAPTTNLSSSKATNNTSPYNPAHYVVTNTEIVARYFTLNTSSNLVTVNDTEQPYLHIGKSFYSNKTLALIPDTTIVNTYQIELSDGTKFNVPATIVTTNENATAPYTLSIKTLYVISLNPLELYCLATGSYYRVDNPNYTVSDSRYWLITPDFVILDEGDIYAIPIAAARGSVNSQYLLGNTEMILNPVIGTLDIQNAEVENGILKEVEENA